MADALTIQGMIDANADVDTIEQAALEDMIVTARNGRKFPSAPRAIRLILEQGTIDAFLFLTKADLDTGNALGSETPVTLVDGDFALVLDDETLNNNGYYKMQSGELVWLNLNASKQALAEIEQAKQEAIATAETHADIKLKNYDQLKKSARNLFDGSFVSKKKINSAGLFASAYDNDTVTGFVPVQNGVYYTISGIDTTLVRTNVAAVGGFSAASDSSFVKKLVDVASSTLTVFIDDPTITHIALSVTENNLGTLAQAQALPLQIEVGQVATAYEPYRYSSNTRKIVDINNKQLTALIEQKTAPKSLITQATQFSVLDNVRTPVVSDVGLLRKDLAPTGMMYKLQKDVSSIKPNSSNNLFIELKNVPTGIRNIRANVHKLVGGVSTKGTLSSTIFTVPSGQFDNPNTLPEQDKYSKSGFVHPSIAYDATGIGGFKYWMIASTLPAFAMNGATWEDEDMFVSNDAKSWKRIRSLYETDKTYTTATLRLPPQTLARVDARQNAILPVPAQGDTIEMSMPADNGAPAVDRQMTLLNGTKTPFKHDPAILIHGGYVYTYHSFHLPYAERDSGSNRFIVCVRTANGVDWEIVRSDGSTMLLTEASSRQIFTKDDQGRYNYIAYFYSYGASNPEIVKYGENDFEFIYGNNFSRRYSGTTPYNFDFSTYLPFQDVGSGNHPATLLDGSTLYLVNNEAVFSSTNRGENFTKLSNYPMWLGGISGIPYKKSLCKGAGSKLILVEAQRYDLQTYNTAVTGQTKQTNRDHQLTVFEYPSITDFVTKATTSYIDAYIDVQLCKVNCTTQTREFIAVSALTNKTVLSGVNKPMQVIDIASMDFKDGDVLFVFVTLNSRHATAEIQFGGIDIM